MSEKRAYDIIIRDLPEITVYSRREQMMTVPQEVFTLVWHLQQELQDLGTTNFRKLVGFHSLNWLETNKKMSNKLKVV